MNHSIYVVSMCVCVYVYMYICVYVLYVCMFVCARVRACMFVQEICHLLHSLYHKMSPFSSHSLIVLSYICVCMWEGGGGGVCNMHVCEVFF